MEWALANAGPATAQRYASRGLQLRMDADVDTFWGPGFTYGSLNYTLVNTTTPPYVSMVSTTLRTPSVYIVPEAAGFHYCLLLSPARAMEWIYVDSLRSFLVD